jgi:hypothetical protein
MMVYTKMWCVLACYLLLLCPSLGRIEAPLAKLTVLALAPVEGQAEVQGRDGTPYLMHLNDQSQGTSTTLVQALPDKLRLEERSTGAGQGPVKRLVWLYKAAKDSGPSRLLWTHPDTYNFLVAFSTLH